MFDQATNSLHNGVKLLGDCCTLRLPAPLDLVRAFLFSLVCVDYAKSSESSSQEWFYGTRMS